MPGPFEDVEPTDAERDEELRRQQEEARLRGEEEGRLFVGLRRAQGEVEPLRPEEPRDFGLFQDFLEREPTRPPVPPTAGPTTLPPHLRPLPPRIFPGVSPGLRAVDEQGRPIGPDGTPLREQPFGVPDIDELRAEPWSTAFEQAAIARADELSGEKYNSLRQQRAEEMARRGITPQSPFWQSEMRKIESEQARESSGFRRQLQIEKIDRRERRTREARELELLLDQLEQQRISQMFGLLGGGFEPDEGLLQFLSQQQAAGGQGISSGLGGIGDLIAAWLGSQRR